MRASIFLVNQDFFGNNLKNFQVIYRLTWSMIECSYPVITSINQYYVKTSVFN